MLGVTMKIFAGTMCAVVLLAEGVAFADDAPAQATQDPEVAKLADGHSVKWNYVPAGKTARYGHSEVLISAPASYVRELMLDYAHYKDFSAGKFKTSRVVDKTDTSTDLYIQVPLFHGMIMLWQVLRFENLHPTSNGTEVLHGSYVRGNVKGSEVTFTMRPVGDKTILKADLVVAPDFAAPQSAIDEELRDACQNAVDAVQARAQQRFAQYLAQHAPEQQQPPAVASSTPASPPPQQNQ